LALGIGLRGRTVRSIRARLLVLTLLVVTIALAASTVVTRRGVGAELLRFEADEKRSRAQESIGLVLGEVQRAGSIEGIHIALQRLGNALGQELVLLAPDGRVLAGSTAALRESRFTIVGDRLEIERKESVGGVARTKRMLLVGPPSVPVPNIPRGGAGILYVLPPPPVADDHGLPRIASQLNRWLLYGASAASILALVLTLALSRTILGPVEGLTDAARRMEGGDLTQRVTVASRDEIGTLAKAFNGMAESLQRSESMRRTLITDVAHELRTPLTNLRCQIEALQDGLQPADGVAIRSLHEEVLLLSRLVTDLQDLALAESGQLPLNRSRIAPADAVDRAVAAMRPLAASRGVTLVSDARSAAVVEADWERLGQVMRNLLSNAVTHTPAGGTVTVSACDEGRMVVFDVRDTGIGIAPEHVARVFDRFYRVDASRARATGGAGLGLAIVKQLVEAHGGKVSVDSAPGRGTRVTFMVPAAV
jgi:signal transduction histidine kinase